MQAVFVGRRAELQLMDRLWNDSRARFLVLYGRRRVGKTRLLAEWVRLNQPRVLFWIADPDSKEAHLRQFSKAVFDFAGFGVKAPDDFSYGSWEQAWAQVVALANAGRVGVVIDEFSYLLQTDPGVAGQFQRIWDTQLEAANIFLCLSGSHLGMMQRGVLSYQAPLYGRASAALHLAPLPFGVTGAFFPGYSAAERIQVYALFGGVPHYWNLLDPQKSVQENIQDVLLTPGNLMDGEARLLIQDFISEAHNYVAILRAIANGRNTPKDIEGYTGISNMHVPQYLKNLAETGYVERFEPLTGSGSRLGRYHITDPYLRFYHRFLASRKTQFALGESGQAQAELQRHLVDFIGTHTWEEICREWVLRAANRGALALYPDRVGSTWTKTAQVDVVGVNTMQRHLVLGECKWTDAPVGVGVLRELVEHKTPAVMAPDGRWQVLFLGFSRSGWTAEAAAYASQARELAGENWQAVGFRLLTLDEMDADLAAWAG